MAKQRRAWQRSARRSAAQAVALVVAVVAVAVALSTGTGLWAGGGPSRDGSDAASGPATAAALEALEALDALETVPGESIARYYREAFGQPWYDLDRNGCDTRNDILRRDLRDTVLKADTGGCKVLAGILDDPYTGESREFVSGPETSVLVQIDHLVALSWAWRHGAEFWSDEERTAFANDPDNLRATGGSVNQSKGDSGPSEWMPPARDARCGYARDFVAVLAEWQLGVGPADRGVLERTLAACG